MQNLFSFLSTFYDSILVFNLSSGLSGAWNFSCQAAAKVPEKRISVIHTKNLSVAQGLIVMRAAEALDRGASHDDIVRLSEEWAAKTRLLVDIATLKYLVRGGRISFPSDSTRRSTIMAHTAIAGIAHETNFSIPFESPRKTSQILSAKVITQASKVNREAVKSSPSALARVKAV